MIQLGLKPQHNVKEKTLTSQVGVSPQEPVTAPQPSFTFEQMYEYDYIVRSVITKMVPPKLGLPDDLSQEIWTQFLEGKNGVSYIEIFDPSRSSPTTFMWEFTRLRCLQFLSRTRRTPTAQAFSIQTQDSEEFVRGIIDPETTMILAFDEYSTIEYADLVERAKGAVHRHRIRGKRDLRWVWYLLTRGFRQDEIAKEMGLSEGTISICMDLIRQIPEVQELGKWAAENGLLTYNNSL